MIFTNIEYEIIFSEVAFYSASSPIITYDHTVHHFAHKQIKKTTDLQHIKTNSSFCRRCTSVGKRSSRGQNKFHGNECRSIENWFTNQRKQNEASGQGRFSKRT